MKIGLIDVDSHHFPNLALMKIAAYHSGLGDEVEFVNYFKHYDVVYKSKVFTWTKEDSTVVDTEVLKKGGSGYDYTTVLPEEIEHITPDYALYPKSSWYDQGTAYGYTTRGCCNHCPWCVVPHKEGYIHAHAEVKEFLADKKKVILMDNNILAHTHGLEQIEELIRRKVKVDFNQGLDARRIADQPGIVDLLSKVSYISFLRIACDTAAQMESVEKTFEQLKAKGVSPSRIFVYCLVGEDLNDAYERVMKIRELQGLPFAMCFRDYSPLYQVPILHKAFARWVNRKALFYGCTWQDYKIKLKLN